MTRKLIPNSQSAIRSGSAIILAVVLTTLLAIIGVLFLFSSRVDSVATSSVGDNHDLKLAVDTVVAQISKVLTNNVPGIDPTGTYYNYPDGNNPWLACLEPYQSGSNYFWQQASNIYGPLGFQKVQADIFPDYNNTTVAPYTRADADGDGVSDSLWMQIPNVNSSKGKPIYAAVRIIDNGGMLNVNTGYRFDGNAAPNRTDGSSQTQINLLALAQRPYDNPATATIQTNANNLVQYRCGTADANFYEPNVVWQYGTPNGAYTPFDISDELELRYRFLIDQNDTHTRWESWDKQFDSPYKTRPFDSSSDYNENDWFTYVHDSPSFNANYAYRHLATTYNMDRIIAPDCNKMFNINSALNFNTNTIYNAVRAVLPSVFSSADVAQITANLMDYIDGPNYPSTDPRYDPNNAVTVVPDPCTGKLYYGFEQPCIYISQIAENFYKPPSADEYSPPPVHSYAIELYKPYTGDSLPDANWQLVIGSNPANPISIPWSVNSPFFVIADINVNAPLDINYVNASEVNNLLVVFNVGGDHISLQRKVNGIPVTVDSLPVPRADAATGWLIDSPVSTSPYSIQRDITLNKCIRRLWSGVLSPPVSPPFLGSFNSRYVSLDADTIQAHPANKQFTNIGEIGQLFRKDANMIWPADTEASVRLNIADANVQNLFKYLTVMDPTSYTGDPNGTKIKGRININTAPWYVLAQLPWVSYHTQPNYNLAQAIVNYRDTIHGAFHNIGELMTDANNSINSIGYYQGKTIPVGLATPQDCNSGNGDAFEERDVIFDRISNLVTVRSDVFTAYILVRVGPSGPQKRVIAIFDRSGVTPAGGKVKIVAIQQVPDSR